MINGSVIIIIIIIILFKSGNTAHIHKQETCRQTDNYYINLYSSTSGSKEKKT